jgi:hypothetical protein
MDTMQEEPRDGEEAGTRGGDKTDAPQPLPSADQHSFNESLRAGVRGLGGLLRERKRRNERGGE